MGIRSKGNPVSSFSDNSGNSGKEAVRQPHPGGPRVATGGYYVKRPDNNQVWHIFTEPGTLKINYGVSFNLFMIGGGGGGGAEGGGGGGAGGAVRAYGIPTGIPAAGSDTPVTVSVTVGNGGPSNYQQKGGSGGYSRIIITPQDPSESQITLTALGGGGGGMPGPAPTAQGRSGGCGGGSAYAGPANPLSGGSSTQSNQNSGYSFSMTNYGNIGGGNGGLNDQQETGGAGGGTDPGFQGEGDDAYSPSFGPDGGDAEQFNNIPAFYIMLYSPSPLRNALDPDDPGTPSVADSNNVWYQAVTTLGLFGGGGGGGTNVSQSDRPEGGPGGGGDGGRNPGATQHGIPGIDYTGGGGGGGGSTQGVGGTGGKGIVVITFTG